MDKLLQKLMEYGLSEREAALYLANLELGESSMSIIAKKAKIKRSTAYLTFKTLETRGLMGSLKMHNGLRFIATKPEIFFLHEERKLKELSILLPQFKDLTTNRPYQPKIFFYEGKEGYKTAVEYSLKTPNTIIRYIGSFEEVYKVVGLDYDHNHYMPRRVKNRISIKNLTFDNLSDQSKKWINKEVNNKELREIRYLPIKYNFNTAFMICDDKVIIFSGSEEKIAAVIESKEIAFSEKQKFDLIWDLVSEKLDN